ncbi:MAG TPA: hypothetical protein VGP87_03810 [Gemmatimonadales bacterium]|nr:hypothetical protein [Gemmatimonadales bacterium]
MAAESLDSSAESLGAVTWLLLFGAMLCALALHLAAPMFSYYGEPDSVALVSDALLWVRGGIRTNLISEYRYYTSPGYIWLITRLLPDAAGDIRSVGTALNRINLAASIAILIPVFLLGRRLAGEKAGLIAAALFSFVPAVFQGGLYGFPTLLAEFFLLWAIWGYDRWLTSPRAWGRDVWLLGLVCAGLTVTALLKADVYLGAVALWGLLIFRRRFTQANVALLLVLGIIPVLVLYGIANSLLVQSASSVQYAAEWDTKFPLEFRAPLNATHCLQILKSMGVLTVPVFLIGMAWLAMRRRWGLVSLLVLWAAAPIAFWFFRAGDSARHHFAASVPVVFGVAILVAGLPWRDVTRAAAIGALIAVNYFAFAPTPNTLTTSGRLIGSGRQLATSVGTYDRVGHEYADLALPRQVYVGSWHRIWYVRNEVLGRGDSITAYRATTRHGLPAIDVEYLRERLPLESIMVASNGKSPEILRAAANEYIRQGFRVFTSEFDSTLGHPVPVASYRLVEYRTPGSPLP